LGFPTPSGCSRRPPRLGPRWPTTAAGSTPSPVPPRRSGRSPRSTRAADLARGLRAYQEGIALDPERLSGVRERIQAIRSLERKYGEGEEQVLAFLERA